MPASIKQFYITVSLLLMCFVGIHAQQVPYLERVVTLKSNNQPLSEVLKGITNQTGVVFSYTQPFDDKKKTTLNCLKKPLRLVLNELFKTSNCTYKVKDKYIIIKCEGKPVAPPSVLTGYIYNIIDSTTIPQASIYVRQTRHSAVSNNYGFFSLSYSNKLPSITISFAKEDYKDTSLVIFNQNKQEVLIYLYPKTKENKKDSVLSKVSTPANDSVNKGKDSLPHKKNFINSFLEKSKKVGSNLRNISDTLFADFSLSLTPYISTNRLLSVNTVNKYALNILGGYSMGTRVFELGGLFNIDKGNVTGTQLAGLFNLVGDTVKGVQLAGILNVTGKEMVGFQASGLMNMNMGNTRGVQSAGLFNLNLKKTTGVSIAGIGNISDSLHGAALSCVFNHSLHSKRSLELTGLFNKTKWGEGNYQLSCLFNSTRKGTTNTQLSFFFNRAHTLRGVQLGCINYADSASGIPIGLLSIVKNGYHKIEFSSDELRFGTMALCVGVPKFYNIFLGGINYYNTTLWTYGYGLGSDFTFSNKWGLTLNATMQQIQMVTNAEIEANLLTKINVGVTYKVLPKMQINLGPTFNLYLSDTEGDFKMSEFDELGIIHLANSNETTTYFRSFIGAKLGIKFF
jgi:hypothetical protein